MNAYWLRGFFVLAGVVATGVFVSTLKPANPVETPGNTSEIMAAAKKNASPIAPEATGDPKLFVPVAAVLRHPRCMNCHPRDDRPRQGDDSHKHLQNIVRGEDNLGFVNARCTACHRDENNGYSGVPGAPNWHLAPLSMGWQGLDDGALCTTLKDESKNGGKNIAALVEHMEADKLVLWGWAPGADRTPVDTPHVTFVTQLKAWAEAGAPCPAQSK